MTIYLAEIGDEDSGYNYRIDAETDEDALAQAQALASNGESHNCRSGDPQLRLLYEVRETNTNGLVRKVRKVFDIYRQ